MEKRLEPSVSDFVLSEVQENTRKISEISNGE